MPKVFDLSKISHLVESQHPARILVVDTNILMNDPNPTNWSVKAEGQNLFVLSDALIQELEFIKQKEGSKEKAESRDKAEIAIKGMASLLKQGTITDGIPMKAGWVIGVPSPRKDALDPELGQLEDIVKAFKRSDTKLLLLTRECHQLFKSTPVTLITGEWNLFNVVQMQGIPCHLCTGFPIEGLKEASAIIRPIDWDQVLGEIQNDTKEKSIVVEATLTDYKSAPKFLDNCPPVIAEGCGIVYDGNKNRPFLWTIPFYPKNIISSPKLSGKTTLDPQFGYPIYLNFLGGDEPKQDIFDHIADILLDCVNPSFEEGKPTLQSPDSVMEMLLYFEYINREGVSEEALKSLRQEIEESEGLIYYWTDWILKLEDDEAEQTACLEGFIEAIRNCWKIGQTYTFSIITEKMEHM